MTNYYWNDWYSGWGWFLWFGLWFIMISSIGNWGYTYRVHRRYNSDKPKVAIDILNERYARGEILRDEFLRIKSELIAEPLSRVKKQGFSRKKSTV